MQIYLKTRQAPMYLNSHCYWRAWWLIWFDDFDKGI